MHLQEDSTIVNLDREIYRIQKSTRTLWRHFHPLHNYLRMKFRWYYNWHLNPFAHAIHFSVLGLYLIGLGIFGYTLFQHPTVTKAASSQLVLIPSADGVVTGTGGVPNSTPNLYLNVATADGSSSFIYPDGSNYASFYHQAHGLSAGTVVNSIEFKALSSGGYDQQAAIYSTSNAAFMNVSGVLTVNPFTSSAWTLADIDDIQIGVQQFGMQCTYIYATVDYTEGGGGAVAPTVTTSAATDITSTAATSVTGNGNVTADGGASISNRGFYLATDQSASHDCVTITELGSTSAPLGTGTGVYSASLTSLTTNAYYCYRSYALNSAGMGYGAWTSFQPLAPVPTVTTGAATDITSTSATWHGEINTDNGASAGSRGWFYSTDSSVDHDCSSASEGSYILEGTGAGVYSMAVDVLNLTPSTYYCFRSFVSSSEAPDGISRGAWLGFQTLSSASAPTVTTSAATDITTTSFTANGEVTSDGGDVATDRGFYWAVDNSIGYDCSSRVSGHFIAEGSGLGVFSTSIGSLTPSTHYCYQAEAMNSAGEGVGAWTGFLTLGNNHTLTYSAGANGSIDGTSPQTVADGASGSQVTATPAAHYHFVQWSDNSSTNPIRTDTNVTGDITTTASFAIDTFTLTYSANANGSIVGTSPQTVNYGANGSLVTATPAAHYHWVSWSDAYPTAARTDLTVSANITVSATFAIDTFTLTYSAGANGSIVGTSPQTVNYGANGSQVTATPATGYHFVSWSDSGIYSAARTDLSVTSNYSVTATFAINTFTLTYSAGDGGSIVGTSPQTVADGGSGTLVTATPAAHYHWVSWSDAYPTAARTDTNVTGNITVSATFAIDTYTLTYSANANGSIVGTSPQTVNYGASGTQVTATPAAHYHWVSWSDAYPTAARTDTNVTGNITVSATFAIDTNTVTVTAGSNGVTDKTGANSVDYNGSFAVLITPNSHYHIASIIIGGASLSISDPTGETFTVFNVTAPFTLAVTFTIDTYTLTYSANANGSIFGTSSQLVDYNANGSQVTATPAAHYHWVSWSDAYPTAARTDLAVSANITVSATFAIDTFTLTYNAGSGGSIVGTSPQTVNYNASGSLVTATPAAHYYFVKWSDNNSTVAARTDNPVAADITTTATFAIDTNTVTVTTGSNGVTNKTGANSVDYDGSSAVLITPSTNYHIATITLGGVSQSISNSAGETFTISNVTAPVTLAVTFALDPPASPTGVTITPTSSVGYTVSWNNQPEATLGFQVYIGAGVADCASASYPATTNYAPAFGATSQVMPDLVYSDNIPTVNTRYCAKVIALNEAGSSDPGFAQPKYTLANIPTEPTVAGIDLSSVNFKINKAGNPVSTEFVVKVEKGATVRYLNTDGTLTADTTPVWATYAAFGGDAGLINTGLTRDSEYVYSVAARNSDGILTDYSDSMVVSTYVSSASCIWDGGGSNDNWSTAENWSNDVAPTAACDVVFNATSTKIALVDSGFAGQIKSLSINTGYIGTVSLGNNLSVAGNFTLNSGTFVTSSYTLNVGGSMTIAATPTATFDKGTGTINFNPTQTGKTITTNGQMLGNLTFNGVENIIRSNTVNLTGVALLARGYTVAGWTLQDNLNASSLSLNKGTLVDNAKAVTVAGDILISNNIGVFVSTGLWTQSASGNIANPYMQNSFDSLTIAGEGVTTNLTNGIKVGLNAGSAGKLTMGPGTLNGNNYSIYNYFYTSNPLIIDNVTVGSKLSGFVFYPLTSLSQQAFTLPNNFINTVIIQKARSTTLTATGDWNLGTSDLRINNDSVNVDSNSVDMGSYNLTCNNLIIGSTGTTNKIGGNLKLGSGSINMSGSLSAGGLANLGDKLDLGSGTLNIAGNFNSDYINFVAGTSTVNLTGAAGSTQAISGSATFYNLSAVATSVRTLKFAGGSTQTILGTWTATGVPDQMLTLGLKAGDTGIWNINPMLWSVDYVNVSNSTNLASAKINPAHYTDGGGNTNWFDGALPPNPPNPPTPPTPPNPIPDVINNVTGGITQGTKAVVDFVKNVIDVIAQSPVGEFIASTVSVISAAITNLLSKIGLTPESASIIAASTAIIAALATAIIAPIAATGSLMNLGEIFHSIWQPIANLVTGKRRRNWGRVIEDGTGAPIQNTKINLVKVYRESPVVMYESQKVVASTYTDKNGKYGFIAEPGKYKLEIIKDNYEVVDTNSFLDFYHTNTLFEVKDYKQGLVIKDIAMSTGSENLLKMFKVTHLMQILGKILAYASFGFLIFGTISIIPIVVGHLSWLNIGIIILYVLLWILNAKNLMKKSPWGVVVDKSKDTNLPLVLVRVINKKTGQLVKTAVSNEKGKFSTFIDKGDYEIRALKAGYTLDKPIHYQVGKEKATLSKKIEMMPT